MKTRRALALALALVLGLAVRGDPWPGGGWDTGSQSGSATITGGTCTTQPVTGLDTHGVPTCANVPQASVTNLPADLANLASQIGNTGQPGTQGTYVVAGCGVAWTGSGYVYAVSACSYYIQGTLYSAPASTITLTAADSTNDRFDAIVATTSNTTTKSDGTAAVNPAVPSIDPTAQIAITYVLVTHSTSAPVGASNEVVHDGTDTSAWTGTAGTGWTLNDTGNAHGGTKDVKATAVASNAFTKFVRSSTITLGGYQQLNLWLAPVASNTWNNNRSLQVTIRDTNGVQVGNVVTIQNGSFGFSNSSTTYQLIAVPLALFAVPAGASVKEVRLNPAGNGGTFSFYADDIAFQVNNNNLIPGVAFATVYRDQSGQLATTGPGTSGQVLQSNGASSPATYTDKLPAVWWIPAAICQNTTATLNWDTPTSNPAVAACVTGTNTQKGVADFADGSNLSMQTTLKLPTNYNSSGTTSVKLKWLSSTTSGDVVWQVATICVADAETDDPSFNTASTVTETTKGTTNQTNDASISSLTMTGCAADELLHLKVFRDSANGSDTMAGTARLIGVELSVPRS